MARRQKVSTPVSVDLSVFLVKNMDPALPKTPYVDEIMRRAGVGMVLQPTSIARAPLCEAILQSKSGAYVSKIDLRRVFGGQFLRDAMELKVVRLTAARMTPQFERPLDFNSHRQERMGSDQDFGGFDALCKAFNHRIAVFGASARVWTVVSRAKALLDRVWRLSIPVPSQLDVLLAERTAIVDGLKQRDLDMAAAMKGHLARIFTTIRRNIATWWACFAADAGDIHGSAVDAT